MANDRLSIDSKINDTVIPRIDESLFLGLDKSNSDRIELFMFAVALGVKAGKRTPLTAQHGFILETSIKTMDGAMSMIYSILVNELRKTNEEDKIDNKEYAFHIAEEYANTGFNQIRKWLDKEEDADTILYSLIGEMDDYYEDLISSS